MVSASDITFWTKFTVTDDAAARFTQAAEVRLAADGGSGITGELRIQALCYLIGDMIATSTQDGTSNTERIGDYSYTTSTTSSSTENYWINKYTSLLGSMTKAAGNPTGRNGGIVFRERDHDMIRLSRSYPEERVI